MWTFLSSPLDATVSPKTDKLWNQNNVSQTRILLKYKCKINKKIILWKKKYCKDYLSYKEGREFQTANRLLRSGVFTSQPYLQTTLQLFT